MEQIGSGSELAGYRIDSAIGRGGMGVVFLAEHKRLGRRVALKLIAPERVRDRAFRLRFERESRLAASIEHPHAVPIYEAGEVEGTVFIAMRYVEGTDLRAVLAEEQWLDPGRAVTLVGQVAGALDEAHRLGLVHRDVKPANVLIGEVGGEEWAYLTDFGATKGPAGTEITGTGEWMGTADYASPEQIQGEPVDARSDVYSLGCVLFEALTGRIPFERENQVAALYAHVNDPAPALSEIGPDLPPTLDPVVARALAKDPAERFPSAGDLARAASAALAGEATGEHERSVATGEARSGVPPDRARTRPLRRIRPPSLSDRPPWRWVGALGVAALLVAAAVLLLQGGDPEVAATIKVGKLPLGIAVGEGSVWVTDQGDDAATRIDPDSDDVSGRPIPVGADPAGIKTGEGSVWVANSGDDTVSRIDPDTGATLAEIRVGRRPAGLRVGEGSVWVTNVDSDTVSRIDPDTERVQTIEVGDAPAGVAVGEGGVWVANSQDGTVTRILPASGEVAQTIRVGTRPRGVAAGSGSVWVANSSDDTVSQIDPDTYRVVGEPIDVGRAPAGITVGESWVWVTNERDDTVTRIDPDTGEVVGEPLDVGVHPRGIAAGEGSVWVANSAGGLGHADRALEGSSLRAVADDASPRIWISEADGTPRSVALVEGRSVLGRGEHCQVCLEDEAVSWDHAEVVRHGPSLIAADLDSRNGTLLNGEALTDRRRLRNGDVLQVGRFRLEVALPPQIRHDSTVAAPKGAVELSEDERAAARALVAPYRTPGVRAARTATRAEVAEALHVSERTVQRRLDALATKLGIPSDAGRERPRLIAERVLELGLDRDRA